MDKWRPFTTNTANIIYKSTENGTDVYYFAGEDTESTPINNWVKFGGFYWRIVRTNASDSTIKTYIDNWYENNFTTYTNYLSNDAVYCNNRELATGSSYSTTNSGSASKVNFKPSETSIPTYDCINTKSFH